MSIIYNTHSSLSFFFRRRRKRGRVVEDGEDLDGTVEFWRIDTEVAVVHVFRGAAGGVWTGAGRGLPRRDAEIAGAAAESAPRREPRGAGEGAERRGRDCGGHRSAAAEVVGVLTV